MAGPPPHQPSSSGDVEVAVESGSGASSSRNKLLSMVKKHSDLIGWTVIDAEADASDVEMDDKFWHEILDLFFVHGRVSKGREEDDLVFFVNNMKLNGYRSSDNMENPPPFFVRRWAPKLQYADGFAGDADKVAPRDGSPVVAGDALRRPDQQRVPCAYLGTTPAGRGRHVGEAYCHDCVQCPRMPRPKILNAFDIIASSPSFDLSGLFQERGERMRFVSGASVADIIAKLEEIAGMVSFMARTKDCQVSIEATQNGQKGALAISAKVFELTWELVMVQVSMVRL
uniref:NAF domain-containing protein n=1 Tax=Oryza rufipogon TaxID=4529 RepID=A0A0E0P5J0_ORYRU